MSNTIEKQGLEVGMEYCANVIKTIGETYFEGDGVATCVQQRKTANICKRKTAGRFHV